MKKFIFRFWTKTADRQCKNLTLRVFVSTWEDEDIPDGYLFLDKGIFSIFIDNYEIVREKSSMDWKEYFKIYVSGGLKLQVYSNKYPVYLNLPVLENE